MPLASLMPYGIALLAGAIVILLGWIIHLELRLSKFLKGKNGSDLESVIRGIVETTSSNDEFRQKLEAYLEGVEARLRRSIQGAEVIRFNPFKGDGGGGNQSFSAALLSENGDGFVLTGIYARERVSVYAKAVTNFASAHELSTEEADAIANTKKRLSSKK